jgi:hypothetical protein
LQQLGLQDPAGKGGGGATLWPRPNESGGLVEAAALEFRAAPL